MADSNFDTHIVLNQNELQNASLQKLVSDPAGFEGQIIVNTTENRVKAYINGAWTTIANLTDVTGLLDFKGGYNANTNTPDLDTTPSGVLKGDYYVVTADGTFFTEAVTIGDSLFAKVDNAAALADWVIVERNINPATETSAGIAEIATQVETDAGTDDARFVTPLKLQNWTGGANTVKKFSVDLNDALGTVVRVFGGGETTYTVTHSLNTLNVQAVVYLKATNAEHQWEVIVVDANTVDVKANGNSTDNTYRIVIHG